MKKLFLLALTALICSTVAQSKKEEDVKVKIDRFNYGGSLIRPYTIYRNPTNNMYYITSLSGHPNSDNATAHVSVLAFKDLEAFEVRKFKNPIIISTEYPKTRLHAPKGMLAWRDWLVMCDLNSLAVFKAEEGKKPAQIARLKIPGAKNLHSIIKVGETIYVSDSEAGGIYKITDFEDKETRKIEPLTKIPGASGMIYDKTNDALLVVSSKVNLLYEFNLADKKESKSHVIGPKMSKAESDNQTGFVDLVMGNQNEIYLAHFDLGKVMIYFRDADRPGTIKQPMKYAKTFIDDLRTPSSLVYDATFNRIGYVQFQYNQFSFRKGLPAQLTEEVIKKKVDVEEKKATEKKVAPAPKKMKK
jgi:hypothetical protein